MDLFQRMWPIDWAYYPKGVHDALIETFHIATLGTLLALILGFPVALMAAKNITRSATLNWIAQFILVASRSVNSLIWALLFVAIFGPGAIAGVLPSASDPSASSASSWPRPSRRRGPARSRRWPRPARRRSRS